MRGSHSLHEDRIKEQMLIFNGPITFNYPAAWRMDQREAAIHPKWMGMGEAAASMPQHHWLHAGERSILWRFWLVTFHAGKALPESNLSSKGELCHRTRCTSILGRSRYASTGTYGVTISRASLLQQCGKKSERRDCSLGRVNIIRPYDPTNSEVRSMSEGWPGYYVFLGCGIRVLWCANLNAGGGGIIPRRLCLEFREFPLYRGPRLTDEPRHFVALLRTSVPRTVWGCYTFSALKYKKIPFAHRTNVGLCVDNDLGSKSVLFLCLPSPSLHRLGDILFRTSLIYLLSSSTATHERQAFDTTVWGNAMWMAPVDNPLA
ncbi:unnamed protein product [Microthlaspi erraticum]|uniref:Uncharacterized protein n=1 Tax=Microthlaspi erraticum TaxID=1685480 RepID=A0A6D2JF07_9BRAS|nr:unnamed protein product [Microthlaspi erraticum]